MISTRVPAYDLNGRILFSWGTFGQFPGGFWGVHSVQRGCSSSHDETVTSIMALTDQTGRGAGGLRAAVYPYFDLRNVNSIQPSFQLFPRSMDTSSRYTQLSLSGTR